MERSDPGERASVRVSSRGDGVFISPYSGETVGGVDLPDGTSLPPVVASRTIYVLTDDGDLVAYR